MQNTDNINAVIERKIENQVIPTGWLRKPILRLLRLVPMFWKSASARQVS